MNSQEYSVENYSKFVTSRFKFYPTVELSMLHVAVGFAGEWLEMACAKTQVEAMEELGDCEFYLEAGFQLIGQHPKRPDPSGASKQEMFMACSDLLDAAKKCWVYNVKFLPGKFAVLLLRAARNLDELYYKHGFEREAVLQQNIEKLLKRYPAGYNDAAAQARADKTTTIEGDPK